MWPTRAGLKKRDMHYVSKNDPHSGLLHFKATPPLPGYARYFPSQDLAPFIEHYWAIEWDLSAPVLRETLPYPAAHIVLEPGVARIGGVNTRKFSRRLEGKSRVLGAKFRLGGLRPFVMRPVADFTDRVFDLQDVFGESARELDVRALAQADHHASIAVIEDFLRSRHPRADATLTRVTVLAERIAGDRELKQVEALAAESGIGVRSLQRLFAEYVGVSPKWLIRRYRLQEAAERMAAAKRIDWPRLALELGYADQAHLIRDFKRIVGKAPGDYFRALQTATQ
jgi:AraC-like DNA-binding protein